MPYTHSLDDSSIVFQAREDTDVAVAQRALDNLTTSHVCISRVGQHGLDDCAGVGYVRSVNPSIEHVV